MHLDDDGTMVGGPSWLRGLAEDIRAGDRSRDPKRDGFCLDAIAKEFERLQQEERSRELNKRAPVSFSVSTEIDASRPWDEPAGISPAGDRGLWPIVVMRSGRAYQLLSAGTDVPPVTQDWTQLAPLPHTRAAYEDAQAARAEIVVEHIAGPGIR